MAPLAIVEHLNPLKDQIARVGAVSLCLMELQFHLEGGEKALHRGVIPAFSLSTHTLERLEALQGLSILTAGVLGGFNRSSRQPLESRVAHARRPHSVCTN